MARHIFIVSRRHSGLYAYLVERFREDPKVDVILDRRLGQRRRRAGTRPESERRHRERRVNADVAHELEIASHVVVTLD